MNRATAVSYIFYILTNRNQILNEDILRNLFLERNIVLKSDFIQKIFSLINLYNQIIPLYTSDSLTQFNYVIQNYVMDEKITINFPTLFKQFYFLYLYLVNSLVDVSTLRRKILIHGLGLNDINLILLKYDYYVEGITDMILRGHTNDISSIAVLSKQKIVSTSYDKTLIIWNLSTQEAEKTLIGHLASVEVVAILPDGRIVSGSDDRTLRIWNVLTGETESILKGHSDYVTCIAILPDGKIVSGSHDRTLRIWNPQTEKTEIILRGHTHDVTSVSILPDGNIISGSRDGSLIIWDLSKTTKTVKENYNGSMKITVLSNDQILMAVPGNQVIIKNIKTDIIEQKLIGHTDYITSVKVLPDGKIITGSWDKTLRIWNLETGETEKILSGHTGWVTAISVLPDGRIASGSGDDTIRIWY